MNERGTVLHLDDNGKYLRGVQPLFKAGFDHPEHGVEYMQITNPDELRDGLRAGHVMAAYILDGEVKVGDGQVYGHNLAMEIRECADRNDQPIPPIGVLTSNPVHVLEVAGDNFHRSLVPAVNKSGIGPYLLGRWIAKSLEDENQMPWEEFLREEGVTASPGDEVSYLLGTEGVTLLRILMRGVPPGALFDPISDNYRHKRRDITEAVGASRIRLLDEYL